MPSSLTHYGFNKEVINNSLKFLNNNEDVYLVGAQGPDPFFFRGIIPSFNNKNVGDVRKYGTKLHQVEPSEVFFFFFNYANSSDDKDVLYSYILGAGLHYVLDRKVHPYVFYKTGFSDEKKKKAKYYVDHTLFETHLDVLLMQNKYKDFKVTAFDSIKCDIEKIKRVSEMYGCLAKEIVKDEKIGIDSFEESYKDMIKIEKFLYSKRGFKKKIVNCLFKRTPLNTMMHPLVVKDDEKIDYLNIKRKEWKDPCLETVYNKSVYDLIEEAKKEADEWIKLVSKAYEDNLSGD